MQLEDIRSLIRDEEGVSPVIGVILMVAITVILAAVIGTFVLGLGDDVTESTAPTADFDFDSSTDGENLDEVVVTHAGGDSIPEQELSIDGSALSEDVEFTADDGDDVTAGDSETLTPDDTGEYEVLDAESGDTVQVVWNADGADSSQILAEYDVPAATDNS